MIIDQVLVVAGRMVIELAFRHFLSVGAGHRDLIPVCANIDYIKKSGADGKEGSRCYIVFGLEDN